MTRRGGVQLRPRRAVAVRVLTVLLVLEGVSAIGGGVTFLVDTSGGAAGLDPAVLATAPVTTFLIPGLLLVFGLGVPALLVAVGVHRRPATPLAAGLERRTGHHWSWSGSIMLGVALMLWIVVQVQLIDASWLQPLLFVVGAALAGVPLLPSVRRDLAVDRR